MEGILYMPVSVGCVLFNYEKRSCRFDVASRRGRPVGRGGMFGGCSCRVPIVASHEFGLLHVSVLAVLVEVSRPCKTSQPPPAVPVGKWGSSHAFRRSGEGPHPMA